MPASSAIDLGPCCCCGGVSGVRNLVMLNRPAPVPGTGWGCLQCGLPQDGAYYAACDACVGRGAVPREVCSGRVADQGRAPLESLRPGRFDHDYSRHPEASLEEDDYDEG